MTCCGYLNIRVPCRGASEYLKHMFSRKNKKFYMKISLLSGVIPRGKKTYQIQVSNVFPRINIQGKHVN